MDLNTMKPCNKFLFWLLLRKIMTQSWKKILGFYNNERSHDFDEDILKTQLQIFSKNFPLKDQLSIIEIENYFKEMEPS